MALIEVARFIDASEAQVAAGALRASGIPVFLQNEHWGQTEPYMQLAMGGFCIWAPEADAEAARAFIADCRSLPSETPPRGGPVQSALALALAFFLGPVIGWVVAGRRSRA